MISPDLVVLSRFQFGMVALFHFLFVPLTLGMSWILLIMETVFIITGKKIYRDMTQFWGKLFGINLAMAVITGLTLEFQFGQNWAYYSQYVGDVFGVPLAVEGIVAFMLEGVFFGVFFFGWGRLNKSAHWFATLAVAVGSNLSALVILVANGYMQHPVGARFNFQTMRVEFTSWSQLWLNPDAQVRFVHTLAAGYVTGSLFVLAISAWYILKHRDLPFAKRSFAIAAGFGLASVLSVITLGDENGLNIQHVQPSKMAAIEAVWETPKAPAPWTVVAIPHEKEQYNSDSIEIPGLLSIIATHSLHETIIGIKEIIQRNEVKIKNGMKAYGYLQRINQGDKSAGTVQAFTRYQADLGYGLLLKKYLDDVTHATPDQIHQAAVGSIPNVPVLFWSFRIMVACAVILFFLFLFAVIFCTRKTAWNRRWFLRSCLYALPLPWIAAETGWIIAEVGRQPWLVHGVLPTFLGVSSVSTQEVWTSLIGFFVFFGSLFMVELFLMFKYARLGPSSLHTGQYYFERGHS